MCVCVRVCVCWGGERICVVVRMCVEMCSMYVCVLG